MGLFLHQSNVKQAILPPWNVPLQQAPAEAPFELKDRKIVSGAGFFFCGIFTNMIPAHDTGGYDEPDNIVFVFMDPTQIPPTGPNNKIQGI